MLESSLYKLRNEHTSWQFEDGGKGCSSDVEQVWPGSDLGRVVQPWQALLQGLQGRSLFVKHHAETFSALTSR